MTLAKPMMDNGAPRHGEISTELVAIVVLFIARNTASRMAVFNIEYGATDLKRS